MRVKVNCPCGNFVGWWCPGTWGYYGGDPPEFDGDDTYTNEDVVYCSQECLDEGKPEVGEDE